jgi:hypothetical protein
MRRAAELAAIDTSHAWHQQIGGNSGKGNSKGGLSFCTRRTSAIESLRP